MGNRDEHIELGYLDIPKDYLNFTIRQKKAVCTKILDEVLESSLMTNEEDEEYIVCQVLFDCRKLINE